MHSENEVVQLYLDDIIPNRFQPREVFEDRALQELAASIKEHGVIQPIIVRKIGEKYEIIAGERRYKASAIAGQTTIPAIVRNLDDKESSKVALLENLQRRDLSAIEEARTYQKILEIDQMTQEELAKTMGKSQSAIANKLRLLTLPEEIQDALLKEKISERHARSLLNVEDPKQQVELMTKVIEMRMTVRELENEIKQLHEKETPVEKEAEPFLMKMDDEVTETIPSQSINEIDPFGPLDMDRLRQNAKDITTDNVPTADIDALLNLSNTTNKNEEAPMEMSRFFDSTVKEDVQPPKPQLIDPVAPSSNNPSEVIEPRQNHFFFESPVVEPKEEIETLEEIKMPDAPITEEEPDFLNFDTTYQEPRITPVIMENVTNNSSRRPHDLKSAISEIRNQIKILEQSGFAVETEEMDFENNYKIIITIDKNK